MVVALKPGRFYGSGLPRPRFYDDVKYNAERVNAPPSVLDPLLDWAREAHWSMGGLSFHHRRLQGRIEGSIKKLRAEAERSAKNGRNDAMKKAKRESGGKRKIRDEVQADEPEAENPISEADPVTPKVVRLDEDAIGGLDAPGRIQTAVEEPELASIRPRRRSARKLGDEFDRVARMSDRKSLPETVPSPLRHRTRESELKATGTPAEESGSPRRSSRLRRTELSPISF